MDNEKLKELMQKYPINIERKSFSEYKTIDEYRIDKKIEYAKKLSTRKLIYLDQKYWVYLSDVILNENNDPFILKIYETLKDLYAKNIIICPISPSVFMETLKQGRMDRRMATAKAVDELSGGFSCLNEFEIMMIELNELSNSVLNPEKVLHNLKNRFWRKVSTILSDDIVFNGSNLNVHLNFLEYLSQIPFQAVIEILNEKGHDTEYDDMLPKLAELLTNQKQNNISSTKSFEELFKLEFTGTINGINEIFGNKFHINIDEILTNQKPDELLKIVPFVTINAALFASILKYSGRKYHKNDFYDIQHSATALGYFDYYFTEKSFCDIIKNGNFKLAELTNTIVENNPEDILRILEGLRK